MSRSARNAPDEAPVHDLIPAAAQKAGKRAGRPLHGAAPRVRLFASVAAMTDTQLEQWRSLAETPVGHVIDELVAHGLASRWSPTKSP